jgi:DNA-binding CsgD family transcriptional regulator
MATTADELLGTARDALDAGDFETAQAAALASLQIDELAVTHQIVGGLYYLDDRATDALRHWEAAFRVFRQAGELHAAARVAMDLARLHASMLGHVAAGQGWAERARILLDRVGPCVEWGYLELAFLACDRPDVDELLASSDRALTIALEFGDSDLEVLAMADSGLALVSQGRVSEGFARLDAALAAISAGEVAPVAAGIAFCSMLAACDRVGDVRRAEEWTGIIAALFSNNGNQPRVLHTHCRVAYGSVLCAAGQWSQAEALMIEALGPVDHPNFAHRALTVAHLASLRIEQGRVEEAADLLAPFEDHVTSCAPLARVHLLRGELDLAAAILRRGRKEMIGDVIRAGPLLALLVDVELQRGDIDAARAAAEELAALASDADVVVLRADAAVAEGRVLVALGDRPAAVQSFERAAGHLAAGERPLQLGLVRLELAAVLGEMGDTPGAVVAARSALACFERLGATIARDRAAAVLRGLGDTGRTRPQRAGELTAALTTREREVLQLISAGLTNAEIGERLFISAKTAEHHVGRILTKLGVRSRAEAAALAVRLAAAPATRRIDE